MDGVNCFVLFIFINKQKHNNNPPHIPYIPYTPPDLSQDSWNLTLIA